MKNASIATGLAVAALSFVSSAQAAPVFQNVAGIAHAKLGSDQQFLQRNSEGVTNTGAGTKDVVITPPRTAPEPGLPRLRVRLAINKAITPTNFQCRVHLRNAAGGGISKLTTSALAGNTGFINIQATFNAAETGAGYGSVVVICPVPNGNRVTLKEVRAFHVAP